MTELDTFHLAGQTTEYESDCVAEDNKFVQTNLTFKENTITFKWTSYNTDDCVAQSARALYHWYFQNSEKELHSHLAGWETYVSTIASITAAPNNVEITKIWNIENTYGYSNWELGKSKEVSGKKFNNQSKAKPNTGAIRTHTAKFIDGKLFLARYEGNTALSDNPIVLTKK